MSEFAAEYYQQRAIQHNIDPNSLPADLSGRPFELLQHAGAPSVRSFQEQTSSSLLSAYLHRSLRAAQGFLAASMPEDYPLPYDPGIGWNYNESHCIGMVRRQILADKTIKTGKMTSLTLEAVAREEVPDADLIDLRKYTKNGEALFPGDENEDLEAYFHLTGEVSVGARKLTLRGLTLVHLVYESRTSLVTAAFRGKPLKLNKAMATSAARDVAATARLTGRPANSQRGRPHHYGNQKVI